MFAFSFQRDMAHFFGSLTHPLQGKRKNNACALWRAGKSLRCWCHRSAPPRGPNCWVPVYHGVSGGRPRWAADSRLTQGPRIVLAPNALFFLRHAPRNTTNTLKTLKGLWWSGLAKCTEIKSYTLDHFFFGLSVDSVTDQIRRDLPQYVM